MMISPSTLIGGKAENLVILQSTPRINVPHFTILPVGISKLECRKLILDFLHTCRSTEVAVRSSAIHEDSAITSFAGMYKTKLHVPVVADTIVSASREVRQSAISKNKIATQYAKARRLEIGNQEIAVIIQEMIFPDISGVILSHSLAAHDGYYTVSITHGDGEAVVSGTDNCQLIRVARALSIKTIQERWLAELIAAMRIIESRYKSESLDVEFAFQGDELYILQCRSITTSPPVLISGHKEDQLVQQLDRISIDVRAHLGNDVLGDMIDINPRELLGENPSALDVSIFQHLFADTIVERVRRNMGYYPLNIGLVRVVCGKPYVSLRASAFSFRPKGISYQTYNQMYEVYCRKLIANTSLQNRVEFSVYAMSRGRKLEQVLHDADITESEKGVVRSAFHRLDATLMTSSDKYLSEFERFATDYSEQTRALRDCSLAELLNFVAQGTEWFVCVARLAFYWKNRFEEAYPHEDLGKLMVGHMQSVSSRLQADLLRCRNKQLKRQDLIERYGHLRPGQFRIFGESYADDPDHYLFSQLSHVSSRRIGKRHHSFERAAEFKKAVTFIQAREEMKFLFSQSLHLFIKTLKTVLSHQGIRQEDAACLCWYELEALLHKQSSFPKKQENTLPMILPEVLIPGVTNLGVVTFGEALPSYITSSRIKERICVLDCPDSCADVSGILVLIPSADPGYDFLFHSGAAGIITKTGGPASHMCIRAIELQMPACIGCGERIYNALATSHSAVLDCAARQIVIP